MEQNILILNAGTRNKVVRYFKKTFAGKGRVVVTDSYPLAPALYEGDTHYVTRGCMEEGYLEEIRSIIEKEKIKGLLSLLDPDLSVIAQSKKRLEEAGVSCFLCDYDVVEDCFDKYKTYRKLMDNRFLSARTYRRLEDFHRAYGAGDIGFPVYCKPVRGSGSSGIEKVESMERLQEIFACRDDYIVQEFMKGQEIGADLYVDRFSGEPSVIFLKKKLKMRSGETDKSVSYKNEALFAVLERLVQCFHLEGPVDVDVFEEDGKFYISEINPRFGGGYIHAYECGVDIPAAILNNMEGNSNSRKIGQYEEDICMMKYFDVLVRRMSECR